MQEVRDGETIIVFYGNSVLAREIKFCMSSDSRREGLLGRKSIGADQGVLLKMPSGRRGKSDFVTSIHMLGMKFPIAAAWLDEDGYVVHSTLAKPWRPYYGSPRKAWYVLEVHPDLLDKLSPGTKSHWKRAVTG